MWKKLAYLIALVLMAVACWVVSVFFLGRMQATGLGLVLAVAAALCGLGLVVASRRLGVTTWLVAGLFILAGLLAPTSLLVDTQGTFLGALPPWITTLASILLFLLPSLALVVAALLFQSGLKLLALRRSGKADVLPPKDLDASLAAPPQNDTSEDKGRRAGAVEGGSSPGRNRRMGWTAAAAFLLGALLIVKTLDNLYWLMVWDETSDGLIYLWLVLPVLAAFFVGAVLAINLPGWSKLAGPAYALLIPAAMIAVSARGLSVDYRGLTEAHAGRVSQAVEAYYARNDRYPQALRQLVPFYLISLPGPVIINGQDWCYRAGAGYYQLGYVDRAHWSSPILTGQVYKTAGQAPEKPGLCDSQIAIMQQRNPGFYSAGAGN
jgi:hypothetical protein